MRFFLFSGNDLFFSIFIYKPLRMEKHILSIEGRITPLAYWCRAAVCILVMILAFYFLRRDAKLIWVRLGLQLVVTIFMWIQAIKRMHDSNKSGWYFLIPIYGFILLFAPGTNGVNDYGEDPGADQGILKDNGTKPQ